MWGSKGLGWEVCKEQSPEGQSPGRDGQRWQPLPDFSS